MADAKHVEDKAASPVEEYEDVDDTLEDVLYARHTEIETFTDLEKQRGTSIPALFNQLYKFVQNPSTVSVETYKRMVDTDDTIGAGVDFLTSCLAARLGRYIHPSTEITEFVNKALEDIDGGWVNFLKEMLSATWAGFSVGEMVWANKENGFVPSKIVALPPTTVLFETQRTGELTPDGIMQYQRNYNPFLQGNGFGYSSGSSDLGVGFIGGSGKPDPFARLGDLPFPLRTANSFNYLSIRIPVQKCIHYPFNAQGQFGNPYGRSLLRRAYKYYVMKDAILQMMMIALDRKGTALTVVYCDPNAMMEDSEGNANPQAARGNPKKGIRADEAARKAFKNVHNDSTIYLPGKEGENYKVAFMPQASNVADFISAKEMCDKSMTRAMLLPGLIFGTGDGSGSWALGQEHSKTFDKICDSINAGFEHVVLHNVVKQIIAYNFPRTAWEKDGLGAFSKRTLSQDEQGKEAEMYEKGIGMGIIDSNDLNDLNKMRETIGFEPRDTIIEKPLIPGMEFGEDGSVNGGAEGDDKSNPNLAGVSEEAKAAVKEKVAPKEKEEDKKEEIKASSLMRSILIRLQRFLGNKT